MSENKIHSKLSASGTHRWFHCTASVDLCAKMPPKPDTEYSLEGTRAHTLMELVLTKTPNAFYYTNKNNAESAGLDFVPSKEMANHVQNFVDYCVNLKNALPGSTMQVEKKFHLSHIHPDLFGTADVVIIQPFGAVHVIDLKYGAGVQVEVSENTQLLYYALGATYGEDFETCHLHIYQPRIQGRDPENVWSCDSDYLTEFSKKLKMKALEALSSKAKFEEGDWCKWCQAASVCPQLQKRAVEIARLDFATNAEPKLPEVATLTDDQIVKVAQYRKSIEKWFDAVEEAAFIRLMSGEKISGLKLVKGRSRREWRDPLLVEQQIGDRIYKKEMMTPAQAEKVLGKDIVAHYIESIEGGLQMAHISDKRKEVLAAKDEFTKLESALSAEDF